MREILFRGQTEEGNWRQGLIVELNDEEYGYRRAIIPHGVESYRFNMSGDYVKPLTLGQYIGLTDKNGKKIFEGDIVKHYHDRKFPESYSKGVIFYDEEYLRWKRTSENVNCCIASDCIYEVIGNIHDNPELLER